MSLCGYNPKAFDIIDGKLYVRDFCGEWVEIGAVGSINDEPTDPTIIDVTEPDGYVDSTPCAKAYKLAVITHQIVTQAFLEIDAEEDPYDFYTDMRDFLPGVDLAFNDLMNMWGNLIPLELAGLQAETTDSAVIPYIACVFAPLIPDNGNAGISSGTYDDLRSAINDALSDYFPRTSLGFELSQREVWRRAFWSIGAKDVEKITYYAQPVAGVDCACPEPEPDYSGLVWWENSRTTPIATGGCSLFSAYRTSINELLHTLQGGYNANYQELHVTEQLSAAATIQELELQTWLVDAVSPLPDYFPSTQWDMASPLDPDYYWVPTISAAATTTTVWSPAKNVQRIKWTWSAPVNLDTASINFPCKFNPKNQAISGGPQKFITRAKIVYAGPIR